MKVHAAWLELK